MEVLLFCLATTFSPGPNNLLLFCSGLNHGIKPSIPHILGVLLGFAFMLTTVYFSQDAALNQFPHLILPFKIAGLCYLFYFLLMIARPLTNNLSSPPPMSLHRACLFQLSNPKVWLMSLSATSLFAKDISSFLYLLLIYTAVGILNSFSWVFIGTFAKKNINSLQIIKSINYGAIIFLAIALGIIATQGFASA